MPRPLTLNDDERRQWVLNHEGLYQWWLSTGAGIYRFVRENRSALDDLIKQELERGPSNGVQNPH